MSWLQKPSDPSENGGAAGGQEDVARVVPEVKECVIEPECGVSGQWWRTAGAAGSSVLWGRG